MKTHRVLIFAQLEMKSPLHLGSGEADDPFSDQPVFRSVRGDVVLPGSTMAGAFAAGLDDALRSKWLGIEEEGRDSRASSLIVDDAMPPPAQKKPLRWPVEIRSLVSLDRATLSALPDHHFTREVVPVGTLFSFFCRCDVDDADEAKAFRGAMRDFLANGGSVGGNRNSGLGRWACLMWGHRTLDMTRRADLLAWLTDFHGLEWQEIWDDLASMQVTVEEFAGPPPGSGWHIKLRVEIKEGLHLSAGTGGLPVKQMPDLRQAKRMRLGRDGKLSEEGELVDYGTALKGRFRTAMELLLRTWLVRVKKQKNDKVMDLVPVNPTKKHGHETLQRFFGHNKGKGGWLVTEAAWRDAEVMPQDHIRLDEFTQHVVVGAKFDFAPLHKGETEFSVSLHEDGVAEDELRWRRALLYGAAKLLSANVLPWGGHASRGYLGARVSIVDEDGIRPEHVRADISRLLDRLCEQEEPEAGTAPASAARENQDG